MTYLFLKHESVLQLPSDLNQSAGLRIVFCFVDFADGLLKSKQGLLQLRVSLWVIAHRRLATEVFEQQRILADPLNGL